MLSMAQLAINGGKPVRGPKDLFPAYNPVGEEEKRAVMRTLDSGVLSKYIGGWEPDFYGGPEVQAFEKEWAQHFGVKYAVAMNSATSGLIAAVGALGISPGDEVIVSPYSMIISATAPLFYGAVPVFADVEPEYFCLDPKSVAKVITPRTKAIIAVDIFGAPYDADALRAVAGDIPIIEDAAQAPGALYKGKSAGTLADIGVYSLNYHKHIHTGEGSLVVTNDAALAERLQLIRNHAEAVVGDKGVSNIVNMVGYNFRLTEMQAALGREQLKKLDALIRERQKNIAYLEERCADMPGFRPAKVRPESTSVFYVHPFLYDEKTVGVPRARFIDAIKAELPETALREKEGALIAGGYVRPLYWEPVFAKKIAFGGSGYPFNSPLYKGEARYEKGMCPIVEQLHEKEYVSHEMMRPGMTKKDLDDVVDAFHKVYEHRNEMR